MNQYHKFQIGDVVKVTFSGTVEGETCYVEKKLYVVGVHLQVDIYSSPRAIRVQYIVADALKTSGQNIGWAKSWELPEERLSEIEPVAGEIKKARDKAGC